MGVGREVSRVNGVWGQKGDPHERDSIRPAGLQPRAAKKGTAPTIEVNQYSEKSRKAKSSPPETTQLPVCVDEEKTVNLR